MIDLHPITIPLYGVLSHDYVRGGATIYDSSAKKNGASANGVSELY